MTATRICDRRDCPAHALHRIDLYGQDFHFCGHHWNELAPVLEQHVAEAKVELARRSRRRLAGPELTGAGTGARG
jgi:hypothetical protein